MEELFLDANAHVPLNQKALQSFINFNNSQASHGHPSSPSLCGRLAATKLEEARTKIAELIGAENSNQIIFTSNCTQACEWGLRLFNDICSCSTVVSPTEHPAVYRGMDNLIPEIYFKHNENGIYIDPEHYKKVICIHLQNESGIIQPIQDIKRDYLFCDMSQSLGKEYINVKDLNVDIAVFGAHKFGGPGGVGFLYLKDTGLWKAFGTGSRYSLDRCGTPDVAGIVITAIALENSLYTLPERRNNMFEFRSVLENGLRALNIEIIAEKENRCPNTTFIRIPNASYILLKLSEVGISTGLGAACGNILNNNNPMMARLGRNSEADSFLRISQWGEYGKNEAEMVLKNLKTILI